MATIQSGAGADLLTVHPTAKAARVLLYDASGNPLSRAATFSGSAEVENRQTATTGAGAVVWGLHNPHASIKIYIPRISLFAFFDGTAAATLMKYEVVKATSVTAFSGGIAVTPVTRLTGQTAVGVVRLLDTGLTTTGIAAVQVLGNIVMGRVTQTTTLYNETNKLWDSSGMLSLKDIRLDQNEILAIRQTVTSVIGDNVCGTVDWYEE